MFVRLFQKYKINRLNFDAFEGVSWPLSAKKSVVMTQEKLKE